jgi:hypothetical protein
VLTHENQHRAEARCRSAAEAKILAAGKGTLISAMLAERLEQIMRERKAYDRARQHALAQLPKGLALLPMI